MQTTAVATRTTDRMRALTAFAFAACDAEGIAPYNVEAGHRGGILRIFLDADGDAGIAEGRRLFAALGGHRNREDVTDTTWSIVSSGWSEYAQKEFGAANVPFDGELIEMIITCSTRRP